MGMQRRLTPTMVRNASTEVEEHLGNLQRVSTINDLMADAIQLKTLDFGSMQRVSSCAKPRIQSFTIKLRQGK